MKTLAIIPARGGSKGFPRKNLAPFQGESLVRRALKTAVDAGVFCDVILSSDDEAILDEGRSISGVIPLVRDERLAGDDSVSGDVAVSVLQEYDRIKKHPPTHVMWLQPTAPLRNVTDIRKAADFFKCHPGAKSLVSCYDATSVHPSIMYRRGDDGCGERIWNDNAVQRRQEFEEIYVRNGAIYLVDVTWILSQRRLFCDTPILFEMPRERSLNVDEKLDLVLADAVFKYLHGEKEK